MKQIDMKISTAYNHKKSAYVAPMLTEVEFRVERGFAESGYFWKARNMKDEIEVTMQEWASGEQKVGGWVNTEIDPNGMSAGDFTFYNTNDNEHGWF